MYVEWRSTCMFGEASRRPMFAVVLSAVKMMMIDMLIFVKSVCIVLYYSEAFTGQL